MNLKEYSPSVNQQIQSYLESKYSLNLEPKKKIRSLFVSVHQHNFLLESEDSTMLLDMDETLVHTLKMSPETLDYLIKNPSDKRLKPEKNSLGLKELKEYSHRNVEKFQKAIDNHKYKDNLVIVPHPVFGNQIIIFRPHLKEFLDKIEEMIGSKDLKDVQVFTANIVEWGQTMVDAMNEYTGKKLQLWKKNDALSADSLIVDDNKGSAMIKLNQTKVIDLKSAPDQLPWVPIDQFTGNLNDHALVDILPKIQERL